MEESNKPQGYREQLDEAIKELNAAYAEYENIEFLINIPAMSESEKQYFKSLLNKIRIYETHAYIRLKTIEQDNFEKNYKDLEESRKKIKTAVPDRTDVESIVLLYNKIQTKKLDGEKFFDKI